ncbi:MAG: hypothetical protein P4M11_07015 [Candidatus Pacebacteria bacterium]|nr:hypothetical protein [Candidatus Paceibacterota bacterium]
MRGSDIRNYFMSKRPAGSPSQSQSQPSQSQPPSHDPPAKKQEEEKPKAEEISDSESDEDIIGYKKRVASVAAYPLGRGLICVGR